MHEPRRAEDRVVLEPCASNSLLGAPLGSGEVLHGIIGLFLEPLLMEGSPHGGGQDQRVYCTCDACSVDEPLNLRSLAI